MSKFVCIVKILNFKKNVTSRLIPGQDQGFKVLPIHDDRLPSRSWWYWDAGTPSEPWRTCETFSVQHILKLTWICLIGKDTQYVSLCLVFNYWNQLLIKLLYPCYLVSPI